MNRVNSASMFPESICALKVNLPSCRDYMAREKVSGPAVLINPEIIYLSTYIVLQSLYAAAVIFYGRFQTAFAKTNTLNTNWVSRNITSLIYKANKVTDKTIFLNSHRSFVSLPAILLNPGAKLLRPEEEIFISEAFFILIKAASKKINSNFPVIAHS